MTSWLDRFAKVFESDSGSSSPSQPKLQQNAAAAATAADSHSTTATTATNPSNSADQSSSSNTKSSGFFSTLSSFATNIKHKLEEAKEEFLKEDHVFDDDSTLKQPSRATLPFLFEGDDQYLDDLRKLSAQQGTFLDSRVLPQFKFDCEEQLGDVELAVRFDENIQAQRAKLMPRHVSDKGFWRNYFAHVMQLFQLSRHTRTQSSTSTIDQQLPQPPHDQPSNEQQQQQQQHEQEHEHEHEQEEEEHQFASQHTYPSNRSQTEPVTNDSVEDSEQKAAASEEEVDTFQQEMMKELADLENMMKESDDIANFGSDDAEAAANEPKE